MKAGALVVDVAIDQGGCFETSHATTHDDPVFAVDGIIHYCVANMPGAVPVTSTKALTNVTLPYVEAIADKGVAVRSPTTRRWPRASTSSAARSPTRRSRRPTASSTRRSRRARRCPRGRAGARPAFVGGGSGRS